MHSLLKTFASVCLLVSSVSAEEWKSADGVISVTVPDEFRFVETESQPPVSIIWVSTDETLTLMIAEVQIPPNMPLRLSSIEQGITGEMGGQILNSTSEMRQGYELFTITNQSQDFTPELIMSQNIIAIKGKVYKLMAMGFGKDVRSDPDAEKFLSSLKIHVTRRDIPPQAAPGSRGALTNSETSMVDFISQKLGSIGILLLLICGIVTLILRVSKRDEPSGL
ncbi:MAG TPA: hypothetical protein DCM07_08485 [Planctomycetaceae bacterium]|nr:hypothetical protein [Gimesia sp.]HAH44883.1 hypothetical protein [Planctomycetaceae bacterium]|tara:strand:- start:80 stop:748 length:669 start_codon:yes stop_codon:yes gene_type:complete